jgi:alanyl-tRNA synthetase
MTSSEIRQSFLDFFKSKQHTIVPSSSLMPDSPNLLFTNAGMNQFVPIFLGQQPCPYNPPRAADTQKCIRAGGKHNDLEDVGLDTYHHTFFEMLGNWSFGDYFKKEAIEWAWELVTGIWKFPPHRLYATVYSPDKSQDDPSDFDQEAYDLWAEKFRAAGVDPKVHIVNGNKKDNFWMMGETGPCGPCSEIHVDLTPAGDTKGSLVNKGSAECIEIWNLVFIQFNANPDGTFSPLPARHVDTGMGFERVTAIMQGTKNFTDFNGIISNYETDVFRPIFDRIEKLSGKKYDSTLPKPGSTGETEQEKIDVAFRVIADHIRTLSFAIADGILPGNTDRNYVLRRILRRAVRYGRALGFHQPFFYQLVDVLVDTMGNVFPEIRQRKEVVKSTIRNEEESFNKTLDEGIRLFKLVVEAQEKVRLTAPEYEVKMGKFRSRLAKLPDAQPTQSKRLARIRTDFDAMFAEVVIGGGWQNVAGREFAGALSDANPEFELLEVVSDIAQLIHKAEGKDASESDYNALIASYDQACVRAQSKLLEIAKRPFGVSGRGAFKLYDTYGFPLDLTELMARERGLTVDTAGFEKLMEEQRARGRAAQKKEVISVTHIEAASPTKFIGYDSLDATAKVAEVVKIKDRTAVLLDLSPFYAEMGGQVGDSGELSAGGNVWHVVNTQKAGNALIHFISEQDAPSAGSELHLSVDAPRRNAIQRHHTVTHLFHWALHEVVSKDALQKGSYVGPDKLTFDFNSAPLTPVQIRDIEKLVNEQIVENAVVSWTEIPYSEAKSRRDITHLFGEKYGDRVRVVQIGGEAQKLNGYSMELCGGTHTRSTGEIGFFRIVGESAIAAGLRRVEAVAGMVAYDRALQEMQLIQNVAGKINAPVGELEKKIDSLLTHQKELEKQLKSLQQKQAAESARSLISKAVPIGQTQTLIQNLGQADGDYLQGIIEALRGQFKGVVVLGGATDGTVSLVASVSPEFHKQFQAGKIIQTIAPIVGGKGGGRPDFARGGGKDASKLEEALAKARDVVKGG